ncbi:regulatory protein, gntR family [Actinomadura meyerae]|uniref:Regulatory protein, gntR family n=1 Tax=Actinomadura meyerae TaxID=240840 RepID=A0A239BUF5_9ACTN|nr:winged helix-turn-helix domain-containing protein [Actinomadura meyerae]SNS11556.1 regulatory protein, gntR family [Actinomadura meyerae]
MMDLDGIDPLHVQLAAVLRKRIDDGTYPPRSKLPSISELCEESGLANTTVQKALTILKDEGRVRGVKGRGTFVLPQDESE